MRPRRYHILAAVAVLLSVPVAAQDTCTPTPLQYIYWGTYGAEIVPEISNAGQWVPETEVWWVQAAAASLDVPAGQPQLPLGDYILHDDTRWPETGALWYMTALVKVLETNSTPVVMLNRPYWLLPGHRFNVRTNLNIPEYARLGLVATGLRYPAACLTRLVGPAVLATASGADLSALAQALPPAVTALTDAATALQSVASSIPPQ